MIASDVRKSLQTQWPGVIFVSGPSAELNTGDGLDHVAIVSKSEPCPLLSDALRTQIGIPCQPTKPIKIRLRKMIAGPVFVEPDIRHANKSPNKRLDGRARTARVQVEIESLLPHWCQKHCVA